MNIKSGYLLVAVGSVITAGCASTSSPTPVAASAPTAIVSTAAASEAELAQQRSKLESLQSELARAQSDLSSARTAASAAQAKAKAESLLPPDPRPGQCYARVLIAPPSHTTTETIVVKPAGERVSVLPAVYEPGTERVLVKEATKRIELIPATYGTVTERVMLTPASKKLIEVPASYKQVTEQVLERAAYTTWKRGSPAALAGNGVNVLQTSAVGTGEVMCLVEVPAQYKTITKTVLDQPATTREVEIPATYTTVAKQVMKTPPSSREIEVPAVYKAVAVRRLVKPASEQRIAVPELTQTVTKTVVDGEPKLEWRTALCDVNQTPANIAAIQRELGKSGYFRGTADGKLDARTLQSVNGYARAKGLAYGSNFIAMEVVKSLGLNL